MLFHTPVHSTSPLPNIITFEYYQLSFFKPNRNNPKFHCFSFIVQNKWNLNKSKVKTGNWVAQGNKRITPKLPFPECMQMLTAV